LHLNNNVINVYQKITNQSKLLQKQKQQYNTKHIRYLIKFEIKKNEQKQLRFTFTRSTAFQLQHLDHTGDSQSKM